MEITLKFNSMDELEDFARRWTGKSAVPVKASEPAPTKTKAAPKPVPDDSPKETAETRAPQTEKPAASRAAVRKALTDLNKKVSGNPAAALIKEVSGKNRFTEVPDELLPELMEKAQEALNNAD